MKTVIISGSHRLNSQSLKTAKFVAKSIEKQGGSATVIDLSRNALPLWDEGVWAGEERWKSLWNPLAEQLRAADSLVVVTPEYAGMAAPALKNFFLFCGGDLIAHKPAMIVAVSSGTGGSYPVQELRGSSYKNSRILYIPDHVIIRHAEQLLNSDAPVSGSDDEAVQKRLHYSLSILNEYSKALKSVRESALLNYKDFPFGA